MKSSKWQNLYTEYIDKKKKGLKRDAKILLESFIDIFAKQNKESKRMFIMEVYDLVNSTGNFNLYLPMNLYLRSIKPEIDQWIKDEPNNIIPLRFSSDVNHLKKAIVLFPNDQVALWALGEMIVNHISMNQHELPSGFGYSGNSVEDIELINFYIDQISGLTDSNKKNALLNELINLKNNAFSNLEKK